MPNDFAQLESALAGSYLLQQLVGAGGMATVYLAEDLKHRRRVAIKVLKPELATALGPERFLREIQIVAGLNHPHIVPLHDSGSAHGLLYFVMPYITGESLRERLRREKRLSLAEALRIARETADGLAYAHSLGIVHRDIKPENILLSGGHAVIADFGIAHAVNAAGGDTLTAAGVALGTLAYMSPEQGGGEGLLDARSDIYSLACVVYEMLAGEPPFTGPNPHAVMAQKTAGHTPRLRVVRDEVPAPVEAALIRALRPVPDDRFATVREFAEALAGAELPLRVTEVPERKASPAPGRLPPGTRQVVAALLAVTVVGFGYLSWRGIRARSLTQAAVSGTAPATAPVIRLGVLPPVVQDSTASGADRWRVVQYLLASELTQHRGLAVVDPLSLNSRLDAVESPRGADPLEGLRDWGLRYVVRVSVEAASPGFRISYFLTDAIEGRVVATGGFTNADERQLAPQVRAAGGRLLDALESATGGMTKRLDLDPWVARPSTEIGAIRAFLQGAEYAYRGMPGGGAHFLRAVALDPSFIAPRVWLISGLVGRGETTAALAHVRVLESQLATASPFEQAMIGWAQATARGDMESRVQHLRVALGHSPRNNILLYNLGITLRAMGRGKEALEPVRDAVDSHWRYAPLYTLWGVLSIEAGEITGLRETLEGALSITPQTPYLAGLLETLAVFDGDEEAARRYGSTFRSQVGESRFSEVFAEIAPMYRFLGQRAREGGDPKRAAVLFQRALDAAPGETLSRLELARLQAEAGDRRSAEAHYRDAARQEARPPEVLFLLGDLAASLGRDREARDYLNQYLHAAPNGLDADRARERIRSLSGSAGPP